MSRDPAFDRFIRQCEALTSKKTPLSKELQLEIQRAHVGGWLPAKESAMVFKDEVVLIVRSHDSHALVIEKLSNKNPVVGRDSQGEVFRYHDEWRDIEEHVRKIST